MEMLLRYPTQPLLRDAGDLRINELTSEDVHHLANARVAFAHYELLQHDFIELREENLVSTAPQLLGLKRDERRRTICSMIDAWLIDNAAFISSAQVAQTVVNTPIPTDGTVAMAYRPPGYGRAIVMPVQSFPGTTSAERNAHALKARGLLDLKGAGVAPDVIPTAEATKNGLDYLGYALRDLLAQWATNLIFARERPTLWTLPIYAVLDLGFDIRDGWRGTAPAGMHVRRAHRRRPRIERTGRGIDERVKLEIELLLRKYGLTCVSKTGSHEILQLDGRVMLRMLGKVAMERQSPEEIGFALALSARSRLPLLIEHFDIQLANDTSWPPANAELVDFGNVRVRRGHDHPLTRTDRLSLEGIIWPGSPEYVRSDPNVCVPDSWSRRRLERYTFDLADQFRRGSISAQELRTRLEEPLRSWTESWEQRAPSTIEA